MKIEGDVGMNGICILCLRSEIKKKGKGRVKKWKVKERGKLGNKLVLGSWKKK